MGKLPAVSGNQVIKALRKIGFEVHRTRGSHHTMKRENWRLIITVPLHKELKLGTLKGIIKSAGLTDDEFIDLL